jgi:tetratricopeptide (TPR) repeat protein
MIAGRGLNGGIAFGNRNPALGGFGGWGGRGWGWGGRGWGWGGRGWGWGGWGFPGWGFGGLGLGWGFGWPFLGGLGWGLGMGLGGWGWDGWGGYGGYGPMLYDWGYSSYANPYYAPSTVVVVQQPYDYSQPLSADAAPAAESVTDQATLLFDQARETFKAGNYPSALSMADQALAQLPNDPTLHEFRSLVLFAMGRFEEAATPLYALLSVGPGWDWATLISLYPDVDTYTRQLRSLEAYVEQRPQSAAARFVLAYHYITQGHNDAGVKELREVVRLQPKDAVSAQLLSQIDKATQGPAPGQAAAAPPVAGHVPTTLQQPGTPALPSQPPAAAAFGREGKLEGTWTANPSPGTQISLSFPDSNHFDWKVSDQGKTHEFQGDRSYGTGILTLVPTGQHAGQPPMVGRVTWTDETHFNFKVFTDLSDDPGRSFSKSP